MAEEMAKGVVPGSTDCSEPKGLESYSEDHLLITLTQIILSNLVWDAEECIPMKYWLDTAIH